MEAESDWMPITEMASEIRQINGGITYPYHMLYSRSRSETLPGVQRFQGRYYFRRSRLLEIITTLKETGAKPRGRRIAVDA